MKIEDRGIEIRKLSIGVRGIEDPDIETWKSKKSMKKCLAGESVGIIIDKDIFVERGEIISHLSHAPIESNIFKSKIFWLDSDRMEKNNYTWSDTYWDKFFGFNRNLLNRGWKMDALTLRHSIAPTEELTYKTKARLG